MAKKKLATDGLTEFEYLEPARVDAVGSPANGIGFLVLKSTDDGVVGKHLPLESPEFGADSKTTKSKKARKETPMNVTANDVVKAALEPLVKAVKKAEKNLEKMSPADGRLPAARSEYETAQRNFLLMKLTLSENIRQANPVRVRTKFGPGVSPVVRVHDQLGHDNGVRYING